MDGQGKKKEPELEATATGVEEEGVKETRADSEGVVQVDGRRAPGATASPESVPAG